MDTLHKWLARRADGNRNNALYWAACRAAEMLERGEIGAVQAWMLVETAVKIGLPRSEAEGTVRSALSRLDAGTITIPPPAPHASHLIIPETGKVVDAPTPRNGPVFEKIPRRLNEAELSPGELALLIRVWLGRDYRSSLFNATGRLLADTLACDPRTVRRHVDRLTRDGWLEIVETRRGPHGGYTFRLGLTARGLS